MGTEPGPVGNARAELLPADSAAQDHPVVGAVVVDLAPGRVKAHLEAGVSRHRGSEAPPQPVVSRLAIGEPVKRPPNSGMP